MQDHLKFIRHAFSVCTQVVVMFSFTARLSKVCTSRTVSLCFRRVQVLLTAEPYEVYTLRIDTLFFLTCLGFLSLRDYLKFVLHALSVFTSDGFRFLFTAEPCEVYTSPILSLCLSRSDVIVSCKTI